MKKGTIVALIVAAALLFTGGIILVLGLSFAGSAEDPVTTITESEMAILGEFDNIQIDTEDCDVKFVLHNGAADPYVVIREREDVGHSVAVESGTLKIKMEDNRDWRNFVGVNWEEMEMTLYVPEKAYGSIQIKTATGDVKIPKVLSAEEMELRSDTGLIWCEGAAAELLDCMTSTGDITVRGGAPVATKLQSNTGDLDVNGSAGKEIHMTTNTGDVNAENVNAELFTCSSDTGEVELENVRAEEYLQVFTDTGDIDIANSDAPNVNIETNTGDIKVPAAWQFQRIESGTGDIHFE